MRSAKTILPVENSKTRSTAFFKKRNENSPQTLLQPKLNIGPVNDPYERKADAIAERIMRMPATTNEPFFRPNQLPISNLQRKCAHCEDEEKLQMKGDSNAAGGIIAPSIVKNVISSSGQALDQGTRSFMEPKFGYDFSTVQIHNDSLAHQSSKEINALAYTHGNHIVFGSGQYQPNTNSGKQLLAHELAHVIQQNEGLRNNCLQRAEADDRSCSGLKDIESEIDTAVNVEIDDERRLMSRPIFGPLLALNVAKRIGGRTPVSPVEGFIEGLPPTKRKLPGADLSNTKYSGVQAANSFYLAQSLGVAHVVGSVAKVHGICIGADKLGHFFDQGIDYFNTASAIGSTPADIDNLGKQMETGTFGLGSTGVFSNADIAANLAGLKFYGDLAKAPKSLRFHIKNNVYLKRLE